MRARWRTVRAGGEDGFIMVTVILVLAVAVLVGGVVISDSVAGRATAREDLRGKRAQQAAEAAVQDAVYRLNQSTLAQVNFNGGLGKLTSGIACVMKAAGLSIYAEGSVSLESTCPGGGAVPPLGLPTGQPDPTYVGNRQAYQHFVRLNATPTRASLAVVGVGRDTNGTETAAGLDDDVLRRVLAIIEPIDPLRAIEATRDVTFKGLATVVNGNVRANGDFDQRAPVLTGGNIAGSGALLNTAGFAYGTDAGDEWEKDCSTIGLLGAVTASACVTTPTPTPQQTEFKRNPVTISPAKPDCATSAGGTAGVCPSATYYSGAPQHRLSVASGQTLTLTSGDYVFCSVDVRGTLNTAQTGGPVRIFVDSPSSARCNNTATADVGDLSITGRLNPGVGLSPSRLQLYVAGDGTPGGTLARLGANASLTALTTNFVFYGPDTDVDAYVQTFQGTIVGRDVTVTGLVAPVITQDLSLYDVPLAPGVGVFRVAQYVQCRPQTVTNATAITNC